MLQQVPDRNAVEVSPAKVGQVARDRSFDVDLPPVDKEHRRHRRCHDFGDGRQIEHRRCPHRVWRGQPPPFVIVELRVSERALMDDASITGDEEHCAGCQRADRSVDQ